MSGFGPVPADEAQPGPPPGPEFGGQGRARHTTRAKSGGRRRNLLAAGGAAAVLLTAGALGFVLFKPSGEEPAGTSDGATAEPTAIALGGKPGSGSARGKIAQLLPRARKVSGLKAMTAECRDASYRQRGSGIDVTVGYKGEGAIAVAVYSKPGNGARPLTQVHTMTPAKPRHTFVFPHVAGKIDHVRVSLTAPTGVDQCYARKG